LTEQTKTIGRAQTARWVVPAIVASQFAPPFMISGVAVALPAIGTDLGAGASSLGLIESLFLAGSAAFLLPAGRLADASEKATLFKLGMLAFGLNSLAIGLVSSVPLILFLRFLQGVIGALVQVTAPALLADLVPPQRRGRIYGSMIGAVYAGLTLGPICAGYLIHLSGWRAVFVAAGAGVVLIYFVMQALLPSSWRRPASGAVHVPSALLVGGAMLLLVLGTVSVRAGIAGYGLMALGVVAAALFVGWQRRLEQPLLNVTQLSRNRVLHNALLAQCLLYTNAFCSVFMLSIYMQVVLARSADTSGKVLAIGTVLMAAIAPFAGRLADRYRAQLIAACGVAVVLVSPLMALLLDERSSLGYVVALLAVQGVGFALFSSPNMKIAMNSVPADRASIASALSAGARVLGMLAGMVIAAIAISLELANDPVDREPLRFLSVMQAAFAALAVLTALGLAVSLAGRGR
jgi:MFS family permease